MKQYFISLWLLFTLPIFCFANNWPRKDHFEQFREKASFFERVVSLKRTGSFHIVMDPKTGMPLDSVNKADLEAVTLRDIAEAMQAFEAFLSDSRVQKEYRPGGSEHSLYHSDMIRMAGLVYNIQDSTSGRLVAPTIKAYWSDYFAKQDAKHAALYARPLGHAYQSTGSQGRALLQ